MALFDRVKVATATIGAGAIALGAGVAGFRSFADAGVQVGQAVSYSIEDGTNWEVGVGTYAAGSSLLRGPTASSNGGNPIALSGTANVFVTPLAADIMSPDATYWGTVAGRIEAARLGVGPALTLARFGDSHVANYYGPVHTVAQWQSDANINADHRQVYVEGGNGQANDGQTTLATANVADRGAVYATGGTTPDHLRDWQIPQFDADVAAGKRYDIGTSDGAFYNLNSLNAGLQADIDYTANILWTLIRKFLYGPNQGLYFIVWGTHGLNPTRCQTWANYWQRKAAESGGRIFFVDTAKLLIDRTAFNAAQPAASVWTVRGGNPGVFGSVQGDGAHVGGYGAYIVAQPLTVIYNKICGKRADRGGSYTNLPYDAVAAPWGSILGPDAGMVGTAGIDLTAAQGTFDPLIPGTGHSGAPGLYNRWRVAYGNLAKPQKGVSVKDNVNRLKLTLSGNADGSIIGVSWAGLINNLNNGVASRRYQAGFIVEYVNCTGLLFPRFDVNAVGRTPFPGQANSDSLPDNFSNVFHMRGPMLMALAGNNPELSLVQPTRPGAVLSGDIYVSEAFFDLRAA